MKQAQQQEQRYELEIKKILYGVFKKTPHNLLLEDIKIKFLQNKKSIFALARHGGWFNFHTIEISIFHWPKLTKQQKTELLVHEFCHIVAQSKGQHKQPHRGLWAELMKEFGYKPRATYDW